MSQTSNHAPGPEAEPLQPCVGVFDSGVGGLSVLRALHAALPQARFVYVADSAHAPYGERSNAYVLERSRRIASHLMAEGAAALVVACNTATAVAIGQLREAWPHLPVVGIEPGVKPAIAATRNGRIGVMATTATLASPKFRLLLDAQGNAKTVIVPRACPELARLIEECQFDAPALRLAIRQHCDALRELGVDTVVLGCTHYAFVREAIQAEMGSEVQIVDTADAVARHAAARFAGVRHDAAATHIDPPRVRLQTTGGPARLESIARAWLPFACSVERVAIA